MEHLTLDDMLQPGNTLWLYFNEDNPSNGLVHIRAIVDDMQVVYREWSYRKQRWNYRIEHRYLFELYFKDGNLTLEKRGDGTPDD